MGVEALADGLEQRRKAFGRALGQAVQVALDLAGRVGGGLLDGVGENLAGLHQHRVLLAGGVGGAVEIRLQIGGLPAGETFRILNGEQGLRGGHGFAG